MSEAGRLIDGRFELLQKLGEGGMGSVYRAHQLGVDRLVALKLLKPTLLHSPEQQARFRNEAKAISLLKHPNIVSVFAAGISESGSPYIAMELLDGKPLSSILQERGSLPTRETLHIFIRACEGIEHAHSAGIIHRDIKPSNLVVSGDLCEPVVKVVDFGIAKILGEEPITRTNVIVGSAFYLSPGQGMGRTADGASDVYALGCSLFETLTGSPPFVGDTLLETVTKHQTAETPRLDSHQQNLESVNDLQKVIDCCLEKDANQRYRRVADLRADLQRILDGRTPASVPAKADPRASFVASGNYSTRRALIGMGAVLSIISGALIYYEVSERERNIPQLETPEADLSTALMHRENRRPKDATFYARRFIDRTPTAPALDKLIAYCILWQCGPDKDKEQLVTPLSQAAAAVESKQHSYQGLMKLKAYEYLFHANLNCASYYRERGNDERTIFFEDQMLKALQDSPNNTVLYGWAADIFLTPLQMYWVTRGDEARVLKIARVHFEMQKKCGWTREGMLKRHQNDKKLLSGGKPEAMEIWEQVGRLGESEYAKKPAIGTSAKQK